MAERVPARNEGGLMNREKQELLVRQATEPPHGRNLAGWPPVVKGAVWLAHLHAAGWHRLNLVPVRVTDFVLASPKEQRDLVVAYRDRARLDPGAWEVLTTLCEQGHLEELPSPPRRGRGRPRRDPRKAFSLHFAHHLLRNLGLRSYQAEEVLAVWLWYRGDSAVESFHRQRTRCRPAARRFIEGCSVSDLLSRKLDSRLQ